MSKTQGKKSLFWPLFQKRGVPRLKNANLLENSTLSHSYGLIALEIMPFFMDFWAWLMQKIVEIWLDCFNLLGQALTLFIPNLVCWLFSSTEIKSFDCLIACHMLPLISALLIAENLLCLFIPCSPLLCQLASFHFYVRQVCKIKGAWKLMWVRYHMSGSWTKENIH